MNGIAALVLVAATSTAEAGFSAERVAAFHRMLTAEPHVAGTPESLAVAAAIERELREMGLVTEVRRYQVFLSHPKRVALRIVRPEPRELPVQEPSDPGEPRSSHAKLTPGFVAYSASGRVSGPVAYVNYGLPADYDTLAAQGVSVRGRIVLARYGKVHRAVKVHSAETRGALGILIYSDPADDGFAKGDPWPKGPWRPASWIQRGNAKYSWFFHGDPLTPGRAATSDAERLDPSAAPTLPRIPALPISSAAAEPILRALQGPVVARGAQGALPFTYHTGPGPVAVELDVAMDAGLREIANVLGRLPGREEPDREVMLGTHHDAWSFGGVDPASSAAVVLELARGFAERAKAGQSLRRSLVFAFWDAEEFGLIGSTEYAEDEGERLRREVVAYVNTDYFLPGELKAGGSAALNELVAGVAGDPSLVLDPLGSGADFVPFQDHLGLPTLSLELGKDPTYGAYHSAYDTASYFERLIDPGWRQGQRLFDLIGATLERLAEAPVLPLRFTRAADVIETALQPIAGPDLGTTRARVSELRDTARGVEAALAARDPGAFPLAKRRALNDHLKRAETVFADGAPEGEWYRHAVYGWNIYALYSGEMLPDLAAAARRKDDAAIARERERLERALAASAAELRAAAGLLQQPVN